MKADIPVDLWTLVFEFALDPAGRGTPELVGLPAVGSSHLFLLCRSLTAALEEWYVLQLAAGGLQGSVPILRFPEFLTDQSGDQTRFQLGFHQRSILALSRAPEELLASVRRTEGSFLCIDTDSPQQRNLSVVRPFQQAFEVLSTSMAQLSVLDGPFLRGSPWLRVVDLQHLQSLREIGNGFLSFSSVEEVCLPASLKHVGDDFFYESRITALDLSQTALESVGHRFLGWTAIATNKIVWPRTLTKAGDQFLSWNADEVAPPPTGYRLDLSHTQLESIGAGAFVGCAWSEILLPQTLKAIGNTFLFKARAKRIDLTGTYLESIGTHCLCSSWTEEVHLPSSLTKVGDQFLSEVKTARVALTADRLTDVGAEFLAQTRVPVIALPSSLKKVGPRFLNECSSAELDLVQTSIEHIGDFSLLKNPVEKLKLPASLTSVGADFLQGNFATHIEITGESFATVGPGFLWQSNVSYLKLPKSLKRIVSERFLAYNTAKLVDLTDSALEMVKDDFLSSSCVEKLRLPSSMTSIGNKFLFFSTAKRVVVEAASLLEMGSFCFADTAVEEVVLPSSLERVGEWFFGACEASSLHIVAEGLEEAGEGFLLSSYTPNEFISAPPCLEAQLSERVIDEEEEEEDDDDYY